MSSAQILVYVGLMKARSGPGRRQGRHAGDPRPQSPGQCGDGGAGPTGWKGGPSAGLGQRRARLWFPCRERIGQRSFTMMLSASTWAPATQTKSDPWTHSVPQAVTSSAQCEKPSFVKVGRSLYRPALAMQPWDRIGARWIDQKRG